MLYRISLRKKIGSTFRKQMSLRRFNHKRRKN